MLQLDPGRTEYDLQFSVLGIPVRVHPYFWIATFILGFGGGDPKAILVWVLAVFISILWHELGHALTMRQFGFRSRIVLYHMGGLAIAEENDHSWLPKSKETMWQSILISFAGPAAGFLLAAVLASVLKVSGGDFYFVTPSLDSQTFWRFKLPNSIPMATWGIDGKAEFSPVYLLCSDLFFINIFWGLVNLLPVIPLDGGQISRELFTAKYRGSGFGYALQLSFAVAAAVAVFAYLGLSDTYLAFMFIILAVSNYQMWQQFSSRF